MMHMQAAVLHYHDPRLGICMYTGYGEPYTTNAIRMLKVTCPLLSYAHSAHE